MNKGKTIPLRFKELNEDDTIIEHFICLIANGTRFSVKHLITKLEIDKKAVVTKENVVDYINRYHLADAEEGGRWHTFFTFLKMHWRLFLLLDYMRTNKIYTEKVRGLTKLDKKKQVWLPLINESTRSSVIKNDDIKKLIGLAIKALYDKRATQPYGEAYTYLFDPPVPVNGEPKYTKLGTPTPLYPQLSLLNQTIKMARKTIETMNTPQSVTTTTTTTTTTKTKTKTEKPPTIASVCIEIARHRQLSIYIDWLSRQIGTDGYPALLFMIEYTSKNTNLFKLLCIIVERRSLFILDSVEEGVLLLDEVFRRLSGFPYLRLFRKDGYDEEEEEEEEKEEESVYIGYFVHHVLVPQFYINLWLRVIATIKETHGFYVGSGGKSVVTIISHKDANILYTILNNVNEYMERTLGYVNAGFDRDTIDGIVATHFLVDVEAVEWTSIRDILFMGWDYASIKETCINETLDMMRVGSSFLYKKKTIEELKTLLAKGVMTQTHHPLSTNSVQDEAYLSLDGSVRMEPNKAGYYNDLSIVRLDSGPGTKVCEFVNSVTLSIGDLYDVAMRTMTTPLDKARVGGLHRLFDVETVKDNNTFFVYDQICNLLASMPAYRPITMRRQDTEMTENRFNACKNKTVSKVKEELTKEIADGPFLRKDGNYVVLTVVKSYSLFLRELSKPSKKLNYLDVTDLYIEEDGEKPVLMLDKDVTLYVIRNEYRWLPVNVAGTYYNHTNDTTTIECFIEERIGILPVAFTKRILNGPTDLAKKNSLFHTNRKHFLSNLLHVDATQVSLYDVVYTHNTRVMIVIDSDNNNNNNNTYTYTYSENDDRVMKIIEVYQRRLSYVYYKRKEEEMDVGSAKDDYSIDNDNDNDDDIPVVIRNQDDVIQNPDEYDRMAEDNPVTTGGMDIDFIDVDTIEFFTRLFNTYRSWVYLNEAEKKQLYLKYDEIYDIPLVINDRGNLHPFYMETSLVDVQSGLFGGLLVLRDMVSETHTVCIEELIRGIGRWFVDHPYERIEFIKNRET